MATTLMQIPMTLSCGVGDKLKFRSLVAQEEVSRLFEYQVVGECALDSAIAADDVLGKAVSVTMDLDPGVKVKRQFNGIATAFGIEGVTGQSLMAYRITVRPWLWLATRSADLRIFQDKTAVEIIKAVLADYPGSIVQKTNASCKKRVYCVQYRETDFDFVSRLMEEEGLFYWFAHKGGKHDMVLADHAGAHEAMTGYADIPMRVKQGALQDQQAIFEWQMRHEIQPGKFTLRDYDFENPSVDLLTDKTGSSRQHDEAKHEVYDYPGRYTVKGDGTTRANVRLEAASALFGRYSGEGATPGLVVGGKFALIKHPRTDQNSNYIVLKTQLELRQADADSARGHDMPPIGLDCKFTVQRLDEPYRPERLTRKPTVAGPQTAKVVGTGAAGDIFTDKFGRVKVQFHWDREGKKDSTSSCWMRVASPWAGNGFGMIALPRLGQEVVVDFLEGDPDQPLITGRVHNAEHMPPYVLPDNASVSTLKSRSIKGGTADFNELRFEDKPGKEYVLLHAQKDRIEFVENTVTSQIGKDQHHTVKNNRKEKVEGEQHLTVGKDLKQKVNAKFSLDTAKDILLKAGKLFSLKAGADVTAKAGTAVSLESGTAMHFKVGTALGADAGQTVHIKGGMSVVIEAGMQISIKAGASSVVLGPDGVSITGAMVKINSGGSPGSGAGASPVAPTDPDAPDAPDLPKDPLPHR